jgi:hypothetical protein
MTPEKPPREVKLTVPDSATQREVLELFDQVDRLSRQGNIPPIRAEASAQPQDGQSALVDREWTRTVGQRRGKLTERPMIGQEVTATFVDPPGDLSGTVRRVSGTVTRNAARELVIKSGDGSETAAPRHDASVDKGRSR